MTDINTEFIIACKQGNLEKVRYCLTSPEIEIHADIHHTVANFSDYALKTACTHGFLDIVQYLLTSAELTEHANISSENNQALKAACSNGHLDIVDFLLTSPLVNNLQIDDETFAYASAANQLEVVKYLTTSPKLKGHPKVSSNSFRPLMCAINYNCEEVLDFFIFDLGIDMTCELENNLLRLKKGQEIIEKIKKVNNFKNLEQKIVPISETKKVKSKI